MPQRRNPPVRFREIEVLVISAKDLKNVKHIKMRTYAEVYVEKFHVAKTHVDEHGGVNPTWNKVVKVMVRESLLEDDVTATLNVDIFSHGHLRKKLVGCARVLLRDLLRDGDPLEPLDHPIQCFTVQVWSNGPQGWLSLWVPPTGRFWEIEEEVADAVVGGGREGA